MPSITYAVCVCTEHREIEVLLSFLTEVKRKDDVINVLVDTEHVTDKVSLVLNAYSSRRDVEFIYRKFDNDFGKHRNYQLDKCKGDFTCILDADEVPKESFINKIPQFVESQADIIYVPRVNIITDMTEEQRKKWNFTLNEAGWINWPDMTGRIIRNGKGIKYSKEGNQIHERLSGSDKIATVDPHPSIAIWHVKTADTQFKQDVLYREIQNGS